MEVVDFPKLSMNISYFYVQIVLLFEMLNVFVQSSKNITFVFADSLIDIYPQKIKIFQCARVR